MELLEEWAHWAELRGAGQPVPLPTATLHLRNGREFHGIVLSVADSKYGPHVLLDPSSDRAPSADRIYVPFSEIQAITDHGYGPNEPVETAPTPLQFRRNLAEWEAELRSGFGVTIAVESSGEPSHLAALDALRVRLSEETAGLSRDREAYKSFARGIQKIELTVADEPSIRLEQGTLRVATCLNVARRMRNQQIRITLESLL